MTTRDATRDAEKQTKIRRHESIWMGSEKFYAHRRLFDVFVDEHRSCVTPIDNRSRLKPLKILLVDVDGVVLMDGILDSLYDDTK